MKREKYIDYIKAISIFCIIVVHVCGEYRWSVLSPFQYDTIYFLAWIVRIGVPLFVMCTGALFLSIKEFDTERLFKKNILKLVICLVIYSFVYSAIKSVLHLDETFMTFLKRTVREIFTNDVSYFLWYLYAIICIYFMLPFFRLIVDNASKRLLIYCMILCCIVSIFDVLMHTDRFSFLAGWTNNLQYVWFFTGYTVYLVAGAFIAKYEIPVKARVPIYVLGLITLCFSKVSQNQFYKNPLVGDYNINDYLSPFTIIYSIAVFLFIKQMVCKIQQKGKKYRIYSIVRYISQITLGIYLWHMIVSICEERFIVLDNLFLNIVANILVIFLATVLVVSIIRKIPFIGKWIV